jgi:antirestriction protein ArdC
MAKISHAVQVAALAEQVTDQIITAIETGIASGSKWVRPWNVSNTFPTNATTGLAYRGMNSLILSMLYGGGFYGGYGQWQNKYKAQVRKGEKGIPILAPNKYKTGKQDANGDDQFATNGFRVVKIFKAEQVDGWEPPVKVSNDAFIDHTEAEQTITYMIGLGVDLRHGGDKAYFRPSADHVGMPDKTAFPVESDYYATLLHELVHWTGHTQRLDRKKAIGEKYGRHSYAFEELVAELGASMLCGELGVHQGYRDDHAHYIAHWLDVMKGDKQAIMQAATLAGKAVDVIRGRRTITGVWIEEPSTIEEVTQAA